MKVPCTRFPVPCPRAVLVHNVIEVRMWEAFLPGRYLSGFECVDLTTLVPRICRCLYLDAGVVLGLHLNKPSSLDLCTGLGTGSFSMWLCSGSNITHHSGQNFRSFRDDRGTDRLRSAILLMAEKAFSARSIAVSLLANLFRNTFVCQIRSLAVELPSLPQNQRDLILSQRHECVLFQRPPTQFPKSICAISGVRSGDRNGEIPEEVIVVLDWDCLRHGVFDSSLDR